MKDLFNKIFEFETKLIKLNFLSYGIEALSPDAQEENKFTFEIYKIYSQEDFESLRKQMYNKILEKIN